MAYKVYYNKAKMYIGFNDEEWKEEYYKTIIIKNQLLSEKDIEDQIELMTNEYIEIALEEGEITYLDDYSILDISEMMEPLESKYELSYEDCVNDILRLFLESITRYETFQLYYAANSYSGKAVEWDGSNTGEYQAYIEDLNFEYDAYIEELYKRAEVQIN